ncbi:hypothetical protein DXG03_007930 [Asterophora parasitica]|uniref:RRM domain-containing protein n=1 Tax=Asterophora parasitica TaxID=117018 RepID=A0A9P7GCJ4_9AGAR|nr:hypothetical protein DXG03_007930 [Asterophora parasitica]
MSSALGKRKDRGEESENIVAHGSTLFVSNLPYTATSVDLQTLFSDIAPVRSAFVVLEAGSGVSKGVGYVSFAIKEDAQTAYDTITKDGLNLVGRNLRVQWAENKPKDKDEKGDAVKKESKPRPPPRPQQPRLPHDPLAIRTIVVSGLPPSIDSKVLWKKIRKYAGAEKVDWPVNSTSGEDNSTAHVLFSTPSSALDAVNKLHAHVFKGHLLSVTLKKRLDTLSKPLVKDQPSSTTEPGTSNQKVAAPNHNSRLIVRNLPFNASEQDLRAAFLPYGPIHSIHIPRADKKEREGEDADAEGDESKAKPVRTKGFAFVWMLSKRDAEKAIEGCNGITIRAGTAETLVSDKQKKKKQRRVEKKLKAAATAATADEEGEDDANEGKEDVDDKRATERVIAVDWALSKEKWKEEKAKMEAEDDDVEMASGSSSESDEDGGSDSDSSDDSDEEGDLGVHKDSYDSDEDSDEGDEDEDMEEPIKPTLPPPETGTTLFVRNVPFNATEDELRTLFRSFGPLRYARITIDHATGRSRGTGFACLWNKEDADRVVAQSDLLRVETTGVAAPTKKNPFTLPSILTPDPSSTLAQSLVLHGRTLDVVRAVTRDEAGKLKEAGEKSREKADKRNMYLLREGGQCSPTSCLMFILPNTPAAETLTTADVERRTASFNARRALLKSNPSLFISKTRLSVRQIPTFVSERVLKRLAIHALRAFEAEVKKGDRSPLTADELADMSKDDPEEEARDREEEAEESNKSKKKRLMGRRTGVKQAKIVRQMERVDPVTGKGRSKGYGFLEMNTHADALRVLRWANNNPALGPLFEEWWKDELKDLVKHEKAKDEKDDARVTRLKEELERDGGKKSKGTLIVEFSIENIQVVQRRNAAALKKPTDDKKIKEETAKGTKAKKEERTPKKRRVEDTKVDKEEESPKKPKNNLGSLIGRKRKERKGGKK